MTKIERDREMTEEKLINAVGELIIEGGFESLDGLIYAYMKKHDFWLNTPLEQPGNSDIRGYLKSILLQRNS